MCDDIQVGTWGERDEACGQEGRKLSLTEEEQSLQVILALCFFSISVDEALQV
jgi:hypothetical protein